MKSLIVQTNSDGSQRRCDAHCYDATGFKCVCICGGANHGVGLQQACDNVEAYIKEKFKDKPDVLTYLDVPESGKIDKQKWTENSKKIAAAAAELSLF